MEKNTIFISVRVDSDLSQKIVGKKDIDTRFTDVAGADEAKKEPQEIFDYQARPERHLEVGGQMPKGVLLVGSPGTEKTLIAEMFNSAIEALCDFIETNENEKIKVIKDISATAIGIRSSSGSLC